MNIHILFRGKYFFVLPIYTFIQSCSGLYLNTSEYARSELGEVSRQFKKAEKDQDLDGYEKVITNSKEIVIKLEKAEETLVKEKSRPFYFREYKANAYNYIGLGYSRISKITQNRNSAKQAYQYYVKAIDSFPTKQLYYKNAIILAKVLGFDTTELQRLKAVAQDLHENLKNDRNSLPDDLAISEMEHEQALIYKKYAQIALDSNHKELSFYYDNKMRNFLHYSNVSRESELSANSDKLAYQYARKSWTGIASTLATINAANTGQYTPTPYSLGSATPQQSAGDLEKKRQKSSDKKPLNPGIVERYELFISYGEPTPGTYKKSKIYGMNTKDSEQGYYWITILSIDDNQQASVEITALNIASVHFILKGLFMLMIRPSK